MSESNGTNEGQGTPKPCGFSGCLLLPEPPFGCCPGHSEFIRGVVTALSRLNVNDVPIMAILGQVANVMKGGRGPLLHLPPGAIKRSAN